MTPKREKVVVAMSGGVDSSVAACLLAEQGYEVVGLFMRVGSVAGTEARRHEGTEGADRRSSSEECRLDGQIGHATDRSTFRIPHSTFATTERHTEPPLIPPLQGGRNGTQAAPARDKTLMGSRAHQGCCSASDAGDARFVAGMLGVPFYALNFEKDFDRIIDYFADEYARGRTPNPCVMCNDRLKFGRLFEYADAVGARYIATGHYARIGRRNGEPVLMRGVDHRKDQSYVLFGLHREMLQRVMFPIGDLAKSEVRCLADKFDLPNRDKPDSVEICFVPDRDYARVVRERRPEAFATGEVVDSAGSVIGRHGGIANYTIGQRRGLRIAAGRPIYVTQLDVLNNRVVIGGGEELLSGGLIADRFNPHVADLGDEFRAEVKIRYLHEAVPAKVRLLDGGRARVVFDEPQRAVTPGQAVVFYEGDAVLGGAWIVGKDE